MKLYKVAAITIGFLWLAVEDIFAMDISASQIMEHVCCYEQHLKTEMWIAKEDQQSAIREKLSSIQSFKRFLVDYMCERLTLPHVDQLLPEHKSVKDLSPAQKDGLIMFESQRESDGHINIASPYLLSGAINILADDKDDPVSTFMLKKMIEITPKDFLKDSEFLLAD